LIVVSDTSPVLNLARIGHLTLLPALYHRVLIPSGVDTELRNAAAEVSEAIGLARETWLAVATPNDQKRVRQFRQDLDLGEAEAIALALERQADLLLVDERRGRRAATAAGLTVIGLLGVVAQAKRSGLITNAKELLDELIHTARFWIGPDLYAEVLARLGE
jgi:predicted nucleic acid-binding protein